MLQRESQRPFAQQQRPKEEERTSKGQRIIRANHQASHIKVLSNFPNAFVTLQTHPDPSLTQRSSPKQAHWYMCRLTHSAIPSQPVSSTQDAKTNSSLQVDAFGSLEHSGRLFSPPTVYHTVDRFSLRPVTSCHSLPLVGSETKLLWSPPLSSGSASSSSSTQPKC